MDRKKILAWITYILNMLVALPFIGLISVGLFQVLSILVLSHTRLPEWALTVFVILFELLYATLWGIHQYRNIILGKRQCRKEFIRNMLLLAGIVLFCFLLFFGIAVLHKNSIIPPR